MPEGQQPRLPDSPGRLRSERQFATFWTARSISLLGGAMTPVALTFAVLDRSGPALLGPVLAAQMVPLLLFTLIGGGVADRVRRSVVLTWSNLAAGMVKLAVAGVLLSGVPVAWILPLVALNGTAEAFTTPALRGLVPELVPVPLLTRANSVLSISRTVAKLAGPGAAGLLVATAGSAWALVIDGIAYLVAGVLMATLRTAAVRAKSAQRPGLFTDLREGWDYFRRTRWIWVVAAVMAVLNILQIGILRVIGPIQADSGALGADGWGLLLSVNAAGLLLGGVVMARRSTPPSVWVSLLALTLGGIELLLVGVTSAWVPLAISFFLAGVVSTVFAISWDTRLQTTVPGDKLSRVASYDDLSSYIGIPLAQLAAVPIAASLGYPQVAIGAAVLWVLLCVAGALVLRREVAAADGPTT